MLLLIIFWLKFILDLIFKVLKIFLFQCASDLLTLQVKVAILDP